MRRRRLTLAMTLAAACGVTGAAPLAAQGAEEPPPVPPVCAGDYCVGDEAQVPGDPAAPAPGDEPAPVSGGPVCHSQPFEVAIGPGDYGAGLPNLPGARPSPDAVLMYTQCEGETTGRVWWSTPGDPATPAQMTPAALAETARAALEGTLPAPDVTSSPPAGVAAIVGFPSFVSVDNWSDDPVTDEACDPNSPTFCVTVQAVPSLSWSPGEPGAVPVACAGRGTVFDPTAGTPEEQAAVDGACAHAYRMRTGVSGRPPAWPGVVTVTWALTYTAPSGDGSLADVVKSTLLPRAVDEVQTVVESAG